MKAQDLVGLQTWELPDVMPAGMAAIEYVVEKIPNTVSVIVNDDGLIVAAVPGIVKRVPK